MKPYAIHPIYFPTTTLFVDDSATFLDNLSLQLSPDLAYKLWDSPTAALRAINSTASRMSLVQKFCSEYQYVDDLSLSNRVINIDLDRIHREVYDEHRFEEIAVVVVDFAMPELDGLEFCKGIKDPSIKKVLLTGKADERIAVRAFNEGLIDRFIRKSEGAALVALNDVIAQLQAEHFQLVENGLAEALAVGAHRFLHEPIFAGLFENICRDRRIVESYLCSNPQGMLLLDATGRGSLLIVQTEEEMQAQHEVALSQGAPEDLLKALRSGNFIPYFWQTGGYYRPHGGDWRSCLYPARQIEGQQWYYYTLVDDPSPFKLEMVMSYNAYLHQLDQRDREVPASP